ncbi:oligosaccharide flippase family protein [Proteus terrae]|uniref:oligosaccharide flippase family protein n=1 Tax=Proteus terrae TaxID=1574161 RepID=UPI00301CB36E
MNNLTISIIYSIERLIRAASGFIVSIILTRTMGIEVYGEYAYILAIINIFSVLFSFGLDEYLVREVALNKKIPNFIFFSRFLLSFLCFLIISLIIYFKESNIFTLLTFTAISYLWNTFYLMILTEKKKENLKVIVLIILSSLFFILLKYISLFYGINYFIITTILESFTLLAITYSKIKINFEKTVFQIDSFINIIKLSLPIGASSLSVILFYKIDQLLVEHFYDSRELGIYALSSSIVIATGFIQSSYISTCYSDIARNINDSLKLSEALKSSYRGVFYLGMVIYFSYLIIGKLFLKLIFPSNYLELNSLLMISLLSIIFSGISAVNSQYLFLIGNSNKRLLRTSIALLFNVTWNYIALPIMGIKGAALGFLLTQILISIIMNVIDKKTYFLFKIQIKSIIYWR